VVTRATAEVVRRDVPGAGGMPASIAYCRASSTTAPVRCASGSRQPGRGRRTGRPVGRTHGRVGPGSPGRCRAGCRRPGAPGSRTMSRRTGADHDMPGPCGQDDAVVHLVGEHVRGHDPARPGFRPGPCPGSGAELAVPGRADRSQPVSALIRGRCVTRAGPGLYAVLRTPTAGGGARTKSSGSIDQRHISS
jgi:hypothetical protein